MRFRSDLVFVLFPGIIFLFFAFLFIPFFQFLFLTICILGGFFIGSKGGTTGIGVQFDRRGATIAFIYEHTLSVMAANAGH